MPSFYAAVVCCLQFRASGSGFRVSGLRLRYGVRASRISRLGASHFGLGHPSYRQATLETEQFSAGSVDLEGLRPRSFPKLVVPFEGVSKGLYKGYRSYVGFRGAVLHW